MQPICKICVPNFDKKCATLLWIASGFVRQARNMVLWRFLPNVPQFGETRSIFTGKELQSLGKSHNPWKSAAILGKVLQSLDCGALQDGYFQEVRHTWRDKCGTHGGISAMHGTPSQSVPQRGCLLKSF